MNVYYSPYAGGAYAGGLEGCKPSKHPSFSGAAEATPPQHRKRGILGRPGALWASPQTPPLRKVSNRYIGKFLAAAGERVFVCDTTHVCSDEQTVTCIAWCRLAIIGEITKQSNFRYL